MFQVNLVIAIGLVCSVLFLLASSFFSASETALVSLSPQKAKRLALKSPNLTQDLLGWLGNPQELLTLILVGNTFANVLFATAVTSLAVHIMETQSPTLVEWISWLCETAVVVILGDMAPKFFARAHPEKTSLRVLPWLSRLRTLFRPALSLFLSIGFFFPKSKIPSYGHGLMFSLDEFKSLLEEGQPTAGMSEDSVGMMQRVLDIKHQKAEDIMTPMDKVDLIEINPKGKPLRDRDLLLDLIVEEGHTRTPVKWNEQIVGYIHSDDLLPLILEDPEKDLTRMVRRAMDIPNNRPVSELLIDFRKSGNHLGFVRDDRNEVVGIVTLEDVLEEITGEILDEYDVSHSRGESI